MQEFSVLVPTLVIIIFNLFRKNKVNIKHKPNLYSFFPVVIFYLDLRLIGFKVLYCDKNLHSFIWTGVYKRRILVACITVRRMFKMVTLKQHQHHYLS